MNALSRRRAITGALAAGAGLSLTPWQAWAAETKLIIPTYGGRWGKFWRQQLLPGLAKSTGLKPKLDIGLGKNFVANIRAGGKKAPYSVFMGNENIATLLRQEGFFDPIDAAKVPNLSNVYDQFRNPGNNGVRGIISPIGIAYRGDLVKNKPTSWKDLWDNPEFKGKVGLYQIGNTAAMLFLLLTAKLYGGSEDALDVAFAQIKKLLPFQQATWSGALATSLVRGDSVVAPVDWGEIVALKRKGAPLEIVVPKEGVMAFEQSFNIVKTGPAKDDAHKYLNYVLDAGVQQQMAGTFFTSPSNKKSVISKELMKDIPIVGARMSEIHSFKWDKVMPNVGQIADRWNREMR